MLEFLHNLLDIYLDTALWLLLGLLLAAVIKGWIPESLVKRWLDGKGIKPVIRAALIGAPLPLCSCGVLPTAIGLRRAGASKPATASFLIATPETGVDSISITYALMGPVMAVVRPVAAVISAIFSGLLVLLWEQRQSTAGDQREAIAEAGATTSTATSTGNCCGNQKAEPVVTKACTFSGGTRPAPETQSTPDRGCCDGGSCGGESQGRAESSPDKTGLLSGLKFAITDILDDIKVWLAFGLVLAAIVATLIEPGNLAGYGSGLGAMLLMLVAGLPLYICATASTPLAAALLMAGMSPGAVLVFMLVGPATNIASIGILSKELGKAAVALYLSGISISAVLLGLLLDSLLGDQAFALTLGGHAHHHSDAASLLQWLAAGLLLILAIRPLRDKLPV